MEITDIKIDGVSVGKAAAYTLKNITEDHRVSVYVTSIKEDTPPEPPVISFQDIKPSDWYNTPVNYAASENLIIGYTDNTFRPKNNMQVSEYLTIMYRFCKERCPDLIADRDTTGTDWKAGARYVSSRLLGTKYMDMDHVMTRYEMADITARIMQWLEAYDNLIPNTREPHGFVDVSYHSDPDMYRQVMYLESIYGIDGVKNTDGTYSFKGNNSITRAETAQVLYNIMTKSIN